MVNPVIPSPIPNLPTPATPIPSRGEIALQILDTTGELRDVKTAIPKLSGEIKSASRDGTVVITTPRGDITVQLPPGTTATPGTQVSVDIPVGKPPTTITVQAQARAPTPDASAPQDPAATVPKTGQGQLELNETLRATSRSPAAVQGQTLTPGQIVQLKPITLATALPILQSNLPTLTALGTAGVLPPAQLGILQNILKMLDPGALSPPQSSTPSPPAGAPIPAPPPGPMAQAPMTPPSPPYFSGPPLIPDTFEARIDQIIFPTAPAAPAPTPNGTLGFFSLGANPHGAVIFVPVPTTSGAPNETAPSFLMLPIRADNVTPGTFMHVTPQPRLPVALPLSAPTPLGTLGDLTTDAIIALLNTLPDLDSTAIYGPAHAAPPIASSKSPQTAAPALLFFLAALRSGDIDGWIGAPAMNALKNLKKSGALEKLSDLFRTGKQTLAEPQTGDFKSYIFPMQFDQTVHPIKLHMRREQGAHDDNGPPRDNQRFILEVNFDRMGPVQLDMLYKPQCLDTVLRTQAPLSAPMRSALEVTYADAMGNVGHTGTLYFQDGLNAWVTVDHPIETAMQVLA